MERDAPALLDDAVNCSFDEFERRARTWQALADPDGDLAHHEHLKTATELPVRPRPEGGWTLTGNLAELDGVEFNEIFSWFLEAEWQTDWADARHRLGNTATTNDLTRTQHQRHADALLAMAHAAASTPPGSSQPRPTVNVLIDHETFEARLRGETPDPSTYRNVVVRTQTGRRLHPDDAINTALIGHIRRVVHDSSGTIIDLGRRQRLFRGAARDAVMLLTTTCIWIGCDRPIGWCDADHSLGWKAHGTTVPRNGQPSAKPTTNSKNTATTSTATTTATGTSPTPTATTSSELLLRSSAVACSGQHGLGHRHDTEAQPLPSAFACASWRVEAATPSCSRPRTTKLSERRFGNR